MPIPRDLAGAEGKSRLTRKHMNTDPERDPSAIRSGSASTRSELDGEVASATSQSLTLTLTRGEGEAWGNLRAQSGLPARARNGVFCLAAALAMTASGVACGRLDLRGTVRSRIPTTSQSVTCSSVGNAGGQKDSTSGPNEP